MPERILGAGKNMLVRFYSIAWAEELHIARLTGTRSYAFKFFPSASVKQFICFHKPTHFVQVTQNQKKKP